ncbi:MAG: SpoIIE family protein phosphatase [Nocardioidaceae bacterium]|nr:SpoIIE family protein phosphatase [Nocardioidaceae bacterium]NUS50750.1 SpoIIE family protein phosphatase [Nocardioidaceae bacterium]
MGDVFYEPTPLSGARQDHTPAYTEADLSTCDREPIHVPGAIQPHGVLLAVDADDVVVTVSGNVADVLGPSVEEATGATLTELLGPQTAALIASGAAEPTGVDLFVTRLPADHERLTGRLAGAQVDVRTHRSGGRLVVEVEDADAGAVAGLSLRSARRAIGRLASTSSVTELGAQLAREARDLLEFDRVMVYRFDEEWNGEVIAEERREDLNPFLGLHYPATDIPAQARRLYTVNWTRLIADVGYTPVPLHPVLDPGTGAPLDLSFSTLRSVSPVHLEYLGNMGVTASMSVSIVVNEQLWGLVACHHYSGPHRPSQDARAAAELLGQVASQMFFDREQAELRELGIGTRSRLAAITARVSAELGDPVAALLADPDLAALVDAQGVALCEEGALSTVGPVPPDDVLFRIAAALDSPDDYATSSDDLATLDPVLARHSSVAAGALRIGSASDRWLLWLRPELVQLVDWGGDPTNKLIAEREGPDVRLSPRKSFEKWREVVRGRSQPWTATQLEAAESLGTHMQSVLLVRSREQVAMAESLQRSVVLDRAPHIEGVEVAARYLPASTYQLAGDWWDAFDLGDGRAAFVVGDVAGHGVLAASTMVQVRTTLRAFLFEGHDPMTCLDRLDAFMDRMLNEQVATALVAIVDRASRTLQIASAGHLPAVVEDAEGARLLDVARRPLLGVRLPSPVAAPTEVDLAEGTTLLLYTDGLVERRGVDLDMSIARLTRPGLSSRGLSLEDWTDRLLEVMGSSQSDDTTLLALRLAAG